MDELINTQYDLHYELLLMSIPRGCGGGGGGGGRGLGGIPMEFVEMDRGGVSHTWKKTTNVRIINTLICLGICTG